MSRSPIEGVRAVAWDVDGTLVDSEPLHHAALLAGTRRWGVDLGDLPHDRFRGVHMSDVWTALRPRLPASLAEAEWLAAITDHYIANRRDLRPLPGAVETIEAFAERGIPQACVSNSHRPIVEANLDVLGVMAKMRTVITIEDVSSGKPDPAPYHLACARLGLDPGCVLAAEDSTPGALSAHRAGLPVALFGEPAVPLDHPVIRIARLAEVAALVA